jgi:WhiB family redox-sensing transcriptional regulator
MITVHCCTECGGGFFEHPRRGMCHMCYERERLAGNVPGLVPAASARDHIIKLIGAGWNYREIARAARMDRSLIAFIVNGRQKINADTAFRICCVDPLRLLDFKAAPETPQAAKARARKAADAMTPQARRERARKAWETRRAKIAETQRRREAQQRRWAAELEQRQLAKAQRAETDLLVLALRIALFGDDDEDWRDRAVCAQVDPDLWFPEKGGSTREAKQLCLSCPVRAQCLDFAMAHEERFGIWGGRSERERRRMEKEQEAS